MSSPLFHVHAHYKHEIHVLQARTFQHYFLSLCLTFPSTGCATNTHERRKGKNVRYGRAVRSEVKSEFVSLLCIILCLNCILYAAEASCLKRKINKKIVQKREEIRVISRGY